MKLHTGPTGALQAAGAVPTVVRKTVTFAAGTTGATTTHALFTVTGLVEAFVTGYCTTALTVGGATTLSIGTTSSAGAMFDGTDGPLDLTTIDAGYYTLETSADITGQAFPNLRMSAENITYTVGTSTITGGVMIFICKYIPLSAGASVVAA